MDELFEFKAERFMIKLSIAVFLLALLINNMYINILCVVIWAAAIPTVAMARMSANEIRFKKYLRDTYGWK